MSDHEIDIRWPSADYADARPEYPDSLFEYLDSLCFGHGLAWDCATGTGQAAIPLAGRFGSIVATDSDHAQLSQAKARPRVYYARARAERAPLPEGSVDLVSVAQALHWFDLPAFFTEAGRVLRPGGVLAAWYYFLPVVAPGVDAIVSRHYWQVLGGDWLPQVGLVEGRYEAIRLPFEDSWAATFTMVGRWDLARLARYLGTWSAVGRYERRTGRAPIEVVRQDLEAAWGDPRESREVNWTINLKAARKPRGRTAECER